MAPLIVEGIYKDGRVELTERPEGVTEGARAEVRFLPDENTVTPTALGSGESREELRRRAFERMEKGIPLGGPPYPKRDELYDRFD
ncbi:MAG: hypothetical protein JWN86_3745 [Planctomycetota bacterium]|nr:hypothetical protein [Planctomycetota bacterium]